MPDPKPRRLMAAALLAAALVAGGALLASRLPDAASQTASGAAPGMPLEVFIRRHDGLGPEVKIQTGTPQPGPIPGLEAVPVVLSQGERQQRLDVYRTPDGRYLLLGQLLDVTHDPFAGIAARLDLDDRPSLGRAGAPVTIVEYSDFQCPYCRRMAPVTKEIMKGPLGKDVRWVYKHFPLVRIHAWAEPAAVASECARRLGGNPKFWSLHDLYFEEQDSFTAENHRERAVAWARAQSMPAARFEQCLDDPQVLARVREETSEARSLGLSSTPTLVMNGRVTPGARSAAEISALVEAEVAYQRELARLRATGK